MKCIRWKQRVVSIVGALAMAAGVGGPAIEARAMTFAQGDLVLAIYANNTEYYRNLGSAATLLLAGPQVNIDLNTSPLNPLTATAGTNPVFWSLLSGQGTTQLNTFINTASRFTAAEITASGSINGTVGANSGITSWRSILSINTGPTGTETLLSSTDPASFTSNFGVGGTLGGNFTGGGQLGALDQILTIVRADARISGPPLVLNRLSDVGRAVLASNGFLSICGGAGCSVEIVPVPAAVVLFGSGLVGLVGFARRSLTKPTV